MITLFKWIILKQKEIKWKFALYQFIEKQLTNPEELEHNIVHALAEIAHNANPASDTTQDS